MTANSSPADDSRGSHQLPSPTRPATEDTGFRAQASQVCATFAPLVQPLAEALGPSVEVVLHDLSLVPNSIVAIAGNLSGRQVGGPSTDLTLMLLEARNGQSLIGYRTELPDGRVCRSSSIYLPVGSSRPVAALCINTDVSSLDAARDVLTALIGDTGSTVPVGESIASNVEHFYPTVDDMATGILDQAINAIGEKPQNMSKAQKVRVVGELRARGFFVIRDAVDLASSALGVSRYSIYNYLNEATPDEEST